MTVPAFSECEFARAKLLLATQVATMMGRKLEEEDWALVYSSTKQVPHTSWSNLSIDFAFNNTGVEHKMLRISKSKPLREACGTRKMHPSATRSIRIPEIDSATDCARDVLKQYGELIEERRKWVADQTGSKSPEVRTGWLLWEPTLSEFLYFEEILEPPDPLKYWATWKDSGGGRRKTSRNLWVYNSDTGKKDYSITTSAGAKIQPYFDVPNPTDPNLYYFRVQGELMDSGRVRMWISGMTARGLKKTLGDLLDSSLDNVIRDVYGDYTSNTLKKKDSEAVVEISLSEKSYARLAVIYKHDVSDEQRMQSLLQTIQSDML